MIASNSKFLKEKPFMVRFKPEEKRTELKIIAAQNDISVNDIVNALTDKFMKDQKLSEKIINIIKKAS